MKNEILTTQEKQIIRVLNFVATYDGLIDEDNIKFLLQNGIDKFISEKRKHLVSVTKHAYPIRIKY